MSFTEILLSHFIVVRNQITRCFEAIVAKWNRQTGNTRVKILAGLVVGIFGLTLIVRVGRENSLGRSDRTDAHEEPVQSKMDILVAKYDNCSTSLGVPKQESKPKVFFASGFPDSIDENFMREIASSLTGSNAPAASYYASKGSLRKCRSDSKIISLCIADDVAEPEKHQSYSQTFNGQAIALLRNPKTLFPAHHNGKAIRYRGQEGQVAESAWRSIREQYFSQMVEQYTNFIRHWDNRTFFKLAMYLPYEYLMDDIRGPLTLKQLALTLQAWGFETVLESNYIHNDNEDDIFGCLWYQSIGRSNLEQYYKYGYEYSDFMPGYTIEERDYLLREMKSVIESSKRHPELAAILQMYHDDIQTNTRIDNKK